VQAAAAGADVAGLVGRSLRTEGQSIDAGVFGTLFSVLKACGASESADHVWYEPGPLLIFAAKVTGASAQGIFVLPTGEDARARLLFAADAVLRQKASPEKGRLVSFRNVGMLDTGDPSKIGTVVRDLYKPFSMPTQPGRPRSRRAQRGSTRRGARLMLV